ncbi:MAG: hypothetical protein U0V64_15150 [Cyclobacteriaceae bacterium]
MNRAAEPQWHYLHSSRTITDGILGVSILRCSHSFMSGMAGNVTAFNSIVTYDIYQNYLAAKKSDRHYLWFGKGVTIVGIFVSIATAYLARTFNNINDFLQLVFSFANGPIFATFSSVCSGAGRPAPAPSGCSSARSLQRPPTD